MASTAPETGGQTGDSPKPGDKSSGAGSESEGQSSSGAPRTFSQEHVDHLIQQRLARFSDYDELKSKLAELQGANQTELERANAKAEEAAASAAKATSRADALLIRSAITAEAARAGAVDPEVVVALLAGEFKVMDDAVDGDVGKAVNKLLDARPYLRGGNQPPPRTGSADGGKHTPSGHQTDSPNQQMDRLLRGT
jgi:hypothetical protein